MEQITSGMQKYENFKEQMGRLNKALQAGFFLEAIFIEYAILEDRLTSALRHSGRFNMSKGHISIESKCNKLLKLCEEKKGIARKYFSEEMIQEIIQWKNDRNPLVHALLHQKLHSADLEQFALKGLNLVKIVKNKVGLYNRALEKTRKNGGAK